MAVSVARCNRYVALGSRSRTQVSRFTILAASWGWRNLTCPNPPLPVTSRRMPSSLTGGVPGPQLLALMRAFAGAPAETLGATRSGSAVQAINALVRAIRETATGIRAIGMMPPRRGRTAGEGVASWMDEQGTGWHCNDRSGLDRPLGAGGRNSGYVEPAQCPTVFPCRCAFPRLAHMPALASVSAPWARPR